MSYCLDARFSFKLTPTAVRPICVGLVGFVISIATTNVAARYVALFLQAGSYAGYVNFLPGM
jgi:hypothetical protein